MLYKWETEEGTVSLDRAVIWALIVESVQQFDGRVQFAAQYKGRMSSWLMKIGGGSDGSSIQTAVGERGLLIRVHVVIRFGSSISKVTEQLIDDIRSQVQQHTGLSVESITISVAGLLSKQFVKRDIEVTK